MRFDFARMHGALHKGHDHGHDGGVTRRDALKLGAAGAAAVATTGLLETAAGAAETSAANVAPSAGSRRLAERFNDEMFDFQSVIDGTSDWFPSSYGADDQRGTFNELTPERTAAALALLAGAGKVNSYQLGEEMFNGFPAFPSDPPRTHDMFLYLLGFEAPAGFVEAGGIASATTSPIGQNLVTGFEERFAENFTFQIATQIDGLGHIGVGDTFYNNNKAWDLASPTGLTKLGNETMGPVITRGVIIDIVGLRVAEGHTDDYFIAPNGMPVLRDNYRITLEDINKALWRQRVTKPIGAGDVPILHTGWTHLVKDDPNRYLTQEPGIYLAESRYFADRKVAMVASDTWGVEVLDPDVTEGNAFPCHQQLLVKDGVRIGESFVTDSAIADNVYEGVFIATPENVPGATCGSSAPAFLGVPGQAPR